MNKDYLTLGPTPCGEDCVGIGNPEYWTKGRAEQKRYKAQLEKMFPTPEGVYGHFTIKAFEHDFGTYHEVCVVFDADDDASAGWALFVDSHLPDSWDDDAKPVPIHPSVLAPYTEVDDTSPYEMNQ
jgi:hypothetical protein